jgi:hypothetical protein
MVTPGQRKKFFCYVTMFGRDEIYKELSAVTKGIESLRDPRLTIWKMSWVLYHLSKKYPGMRKIVKSEPNLIRLITSDHKRAINILKRNLKLSDQQFLTMCSRAIKKDYPETADEAIMLIGILNGIQKKRHMNRNRG